MLHARALSLSLVLSLAAALPAGAWNPRELWEAWPEVRVVETPAPCLAADELERELAGLAAQHPAELRVEEIGRSGQGRPISLLTVGDGGRKVLLWSQMHGDEPSATPALLDLVGHLLANPDRPESRAILDRLTLLIIPMLNPDGAAAYVRGNAQGIDVNRDALHLATPEGRLLKSVRDRHRPILGFNLHDQNRRRTVGDTGVLTTNAVLAVAGDEERTVTPGRERAMRASVAMAAAIEPFAPGGVARYDDTFSPRAFGDNITRWGTPVVLLESGGLPPGRPFTDLTRLDFVALLSALEGLAADDLATYDAALYEMIPENELGDWVDVVVRGGRVRQPGTSEPYRADLAFDVFRSDRVWAGCAPPGPGRSRLAEVGDSRQLVAGREVAAEGRLLLPPWRVVVRGWQAGGWLDGSALERLTRLGVGDVAWVVPAPHYRAAMLRADRLAAAGRARLEVRLEPAAAEELAGADEGGAGRGPLELGAAPKEAESNALADVLAALLGEPAAADLLRLPVDEALARLWGTADDGPGWPLLVPGEGASFLVLAPATATADDVDLEADRLIAAWIRGQEVPAAMPAAVPASGTGGAR